jgi:GNAT superfamily N-acetyltransferase
LDIVVADIEIKDLDVDNLEDIVKPCICEEWAKRVAENTGVNIERVRESLYKGAGMKIDWIKRRLHLGYKAKILYEKEKPIGFVDYLPVAMQTEIAGQDIALINCISIIPSYRGKGYGKLLLGEAELDAKKFSKGIAVVAHNHPKWMPVSFFTKMGYKAVDERDDRIKEILMLKAFQSVKAPRFVRQKYKPELEFGKVVVEILWSGVCPHNVLSVELLKDSLNKFGGILVKEVATNDLSQDVIHNYGHDYGVYINGKPNFWLLGASNDEIYREMKKAIEENDK